MHDSTPKQELDFIIIGAQKAGTTSLFKHLAAHPAVYMPPEKEAPFFNLDAQYEKGWAWYLAEYFAGAAPDLLWGTASPPYMAHHPKSVRRMARHVPRVKLMAILRDPLDRAYSHYKMSVRRGLEQRPFEEAIVQLLRPEALQAARLHPDETTGYIAWGEYGRILRDFLDYYPRQQLLILFTATLRDAPDRVMEEACRFLGVDVVYPDNLGKKFHQGGLEQRLPWAKGLVKETPLSRLWQLVPESARRRTRYWFEQWNTMPDADDGPQLSAATRDRLREHFAADYALLQQAVKVTPPWSLATSDAEGEAR